MAVSQTKARELASCPRLGEMTTVSRARAGAGPVEPAKLSALIPAGLRSDADPRR
jgi:hypothetical protein